MKRAALKKSHNDIPPYRLAEVYHGEKDWFVYYYYYCFVKAAYVRQKVRVGVKGLNPARRQVLLETVRDELNAEFTRRNRDGIYHAAVSAQPQVRAQQLMFLTWLTATRENPKLVKDVMQLYRKIEFNFQLFVQSYTQYAELLAWEVTVQVVTDYIEWFTVCRKTSKSINDHVRGWDLLIKELVKQKHLPAVLDIKHLRVKLIKNQTGKYPPLTHEEKERAFAYFRQHYPSYYLFLLCVYYTCIRPGELHRLRVRDFRLSGRTIYVDWFNAKNGLSQHVQILQPLYDALIAAGVQNMPQSWFLFGDRCEPSKDQYKEDYSSKHWFRHRKHMDMPEKKTPYGLKHTFNVDYVENNKYNLDWEFLRRHNRHATVQQTQEYISGLTAYFLDESKHIILDYTGGK